MAVPLTRQGGEGEKSWVRATTSPPELIAAVVSILRVIWLRAETDWSEGVTEMMRWAREGANSSRTINITILLQ